MNESQTWLGMDERARDQARAVTRRTLAGIRQAPDPVPPSDRRIFDAIEALLEDDRVILAGCLILVHGASIFDVEDFAHDALRGLLRSIKAAHDAAMAFDPEAN